MIEKGQDWCRPHMVAWQKFIKDSDRVEQSAGYAQAVEAARKKHDKGTHGVVTGRDGLYILIYCVPLKKTVKPRYVFSKQPDQRLVDDVQDRRHDRAIRACLKRGEAYEQIGATLGISRYFVQKRVLLMRAAGVEI